MSKISKFYEKKRKAAIKIPSKEEQKRMREIEESCARARARRKNIALLSLEKERFRREYFATLRPDNTSKIYPSLIENKANPAVTAKRGIIEQKIKLNSMDPEMREREERAINEAIKTSKSVAPAYNKGGYQLISRSDLHSIGKKL